MIHKQLYETMDRADFVSVADKVVEMIEHSWMRPHCEFLVTDFDIFRMERAPYAANGITGTFSVFYLLRKVKG